MFSGTEEEYGI